LVKLRHTNISSTEGEVCGLSSRHQNSFTVHVVSTNP